MDFELGPELQLLQQTIREFARSEILPHCARWNEEERFPHEIIPKLGALGLLGMTVPERYGGSEMSLQAVALVVEELAAVDGSVAITVASHNGLCCGHIVLAGTEEQKQRYLPDLASGRVLGAWALTEPGSGSDAAALRTRAHRLPDGSWSLSGTKTFITQGSVAGTYVIMALTTPERRQHGITAFIVEKGTPGFRPGRVIKKMGLHASDTTELELEDVRLPDSQRLGEVDRGFVDTLKILDRGRITIAAMALGLGRGAYEAALSYARQRHAFGRPLAQHQAIQNMLADSATELEAARLLIRRAAWMHDAGQRVTLQAAMAKLYAARAAMRVCDRAVQIHGGYGYTREFPVERALRDAKLCEIGEGTNEVQRIVISRQLLSGGEVLVSGVP
ncbi:MAG: acyl-CoA dehydrogenase family protein [Myxococcales bacterium]|nr:acyl-CoA dehydrogenase family protein [Myxococcota bacterium]MDW8281161.1 acyl-CoA dehydrogenase family protein [Myxococcales bacterium]